MCVCVCGGGEVVEWNDRQITKPMALLIVKKNNPGHQLCTRKQKAENAFAFACNTNKPDFYGLISQFGVVIVHFLYLF